MPQQPRRKPFWQTGHPYPLRRHIRTTGTRAFKARSTAIAAAFRYKIATAYRPIAVFIRRLHRVVKWFHLTEAVGQLTWGD